MDFSEAQELLGNAAASDAAVEGAPSLPQTESSPPAPTGESPQGAQQGAAAEQDSFTPINPDTLPEELQPLAKQLQADYTRKTQALAEQRKAYEAFGEADPNAVLESYQFVQALQNDPQVAMQVHQELTRALQAQGLPLGQAQDVAAQHMQMQQQEDPWAEEGFSMGVDPQVQAKLDQFDQFMQNYQAQQEQQQFVAEMQRQEFAIRQQHPEYTDGDIQRIYELGTWHGDLVKAEQAYSTMRSEWAANLLKEKANAPITTPGAGVQGQMPPEPPHTLEEADAMAREYLKQAGLETML